ncbi:MAG: hypothetical protein IPQ08_15395 [Chitinophagaceae bacterium]|nr:hypothetical protein [Chitinophagaceae bacterium]
MACLKIERVLFIGCRKDQQLIKAVPPTVSGKEKVTIFEALYDLDIVGNDEEKYQYEKWILNPNIMEQVKKCFH